MRQLFRKIIKSLGLGEQGTVTIYLAIVFGAMLLLIGLFVDLGRIKIAQNQLRRVANAAARSVLADYSPFLKNEFGLFAVNQPDCSEEFAGYVKANFAGPAGPAFNLLDYRYEDSSLIFHQPLKDPVVLKQQILEEMKYSAPLEVTKALLEKFKPLGEMARFYDAQNQRRGTAKAINNRLQVISRINQQIKAGRDELRMAKRSLREINEEAGKIKNRRRKSPADWERLEELAGRRNEQFQQIARIKAEIQTGIDASKKKREEIQTDLDTLAREPDGLQDSAEGDQISRKIRREMEDLNKEIVATKQKNLLAVGNSIETAGQAVQTLAADSAEINEGELSRINLDAADQICNELGNLGLDLSQERALNVDRDIYRRLFKSRPEFADEAAEPEPIASGVNNFGGDDSAKADERAKTLNNIFSILNLAETSVNLRNELYLNEYALAHFSCLTGSPETGQAGVAQNTEVEYILYGSNAKQKAIAQLYGTRFALDTLASFVFSKPPAPTDLGARTVYSLIMGAAQASVDTYKLLADRNNDVAVAEIRPAPSNPLNHLRLNYQDHLRLFLLLAHGQENENSKLQRIADLINRKSNGQAWPAYTLADGRVEASIRLWFLPLAGLKKIKHGPFGTEIKNGRCYLAKTVEFGY